jgi:hypothetical protein
VSPSDYRPAAAAPTAWQTFAKQLQNGFQEQLAADDVAQEVQRAMAARVSGGNAPAEVLVRAWILPSGQIERVEFNQIAPLFAIRLRAILSRANVGAPPADMLQPVHVRLSLRPKEQPKPDQPAQSQKFGQGP